MQYTTTLLTVHAITKRRPVVQKHKGIMRQIPKTMFCWQMSYTNLHHSSARSFGYTSSLLWLRTKPFVRFYFLNAVRYTQNSWTPELNLINKPPMLGDIKEKVAAVTHRWFKTDQTQQISFPVCITRRYVSLMTWPIFYAHHASVRRPPRHY